MTIKQLAEEIKNIKDNHLAHLQSDLTKVEKRVESIDNRIWAVLIILVGSVVALVFRGI